MDTFLARIAKFAATMADTALPIPAETPRSLTPSAPTPATDGFALQASSALAGWAMTGLKKSVLGSEITNGVERPDSAPPTQTRFRDTPQELKGLGSQGDVDAWKDEEFDEDMWGKPTPAPTTSRTRQKSAPASQGVGMKLPVRSKKSIIEQVVEEERKGSVDEAVWPGLDDWEDDSKDDGWGFDD
jgi:hypothetical protein